MLRGLGSFLLLTVSVLPQGAEPRWRSLLPGPGLEGWRVVGGGDFRRVGEEIHATSSRKSFLVSEGSFGDFDFEGWVRVDAGANSGFQFRSRVNAKGRVIGYQAEVDPSPRRWAGGLYDEGRRGWLAPLEGRPEAQAAFDPAAWNRYRVSCRGDRIRIRVNGMLTTDTRDPLALAGHFALQHHGERGKTVRFRDLRVRVFGRSRFVPCPGGPGVTTAASGDASAEPSKRGAALAAAPGGRRYAWQPPKRPSPGNTWRLRIDPQETRVRFIPFGRPPESEAEGARPLVVLVERSPDLGALRWGGEDLVKASTERLAAVPRRDGPLDLVVSAHAGRLTVHLNGVLLHDFGDMELPNGARGGPSLEVVGLAEHAGRLHGLEHLVSE